MDRLDGMRIFSLVAEQEGFASAARTLGMSAATVTRAVAMLEHSLGARLLVRTTRSVKLTEVGFRYLQDCRRILAEIDEAEAQAAGSFSAPAGTLTITAPTIFGRLYVLPIILEFLDQYPGISIRTAFVDRVTNLIDEGIDVAVRIAHLPVSGLSALRVGYVRRVICGAPAYFEKHGIPKTPKDLHVHRFVARSGLFGTLEWSFGRNSEIRIPVTSRFLCNTNEAAIDAVAAGWGISRFLSYQVAHDIQSGRLQHVLADFEEEPVPIHVVHAEGRVASARMRAFVDFAAKRLRASEHIGG
ncbi:LysR family transcriptional regulator [Phyllobacterium myrsinacearum]|uniref:DNA-binding transcriptional LysR family regulator n=1 Tax=Phyllobacterium myrsinacearum TaxID=28101 RepID=A0A839EQ30_9HYPH|nr:LysR family transcriptional regulator [Phyllobacterium myrsinacearum]MBA8880922.1 DNA-binding transcriptional LysR family regulator [Phyllobacterium myrsinacearum]